MMRYTHRAASTAFLTCLLGSALVACGDDDDDAPPVEMDSCGPNGTLDPNAGTEGPQCDCDAGYEEQDGVCVESMASACDAGFTEVDGTCVKDLDLDARIFVADGAEASVTVVDLVEGQVTESHTLTGAARIYSSTDGRWIFAVQRSSNLVNIFDSGYQLEDHGDHVDQVKVSTELMGLVLEDPQPTHFVTHDHYAVIFNDGAAATDDSDEIPASATIVDTRELETPGYVPVNVTTEAAHHGVAVAVSDAELVITLPDGVGGALPVGVEITDHDGVRLETFAGCPLLHGEASAGPHVVFGCSDGVLVVSRTDSGWTSSKILNPEGTPEGQRVGTVRATQSEDIFLGNFGATGLARIDVAAGAMTPIELPTEYYSFAAPKVGEGIVLLGRDGAIHLLDEQGASQRSLDDVTAAPDPDAPPHSPTGSFILLEDYAVVSHPGTGDIHMVELSTMERVRQFSVGGQPTTLAAGRFAE